MSRSSLTYVPSALEWCINARPEETNSSLSQAMSEIWIFIPIIALYDYRINKISQYKLNEANELKLPSDIVDNSTVEVGYTVDTDVLMLLLVMVSSMVIVGGADSLDLPSLFFVLEWKLFDVVTGVVVIVVKSVEVVTVGPM